MISVMFVVVSTVAMVINTLPALAGPLDDKAGRADGQGAGWGRAGGSDRVGGQAGRAGRGDRAGGYSGRTGRADSEGEQGGWTKRADRADGQCGRVGGRTGLQNNEKLKIMLGACCRNQIYHSLRLCYLRQKYVVTAAFSPFL